MRPRIDKRSCPSVGPSVPPFACPEFIHSVTVCVHPPKRTDRGIDQLPIFFSLLSASSTHPSIDRSTQLGDIRWVDDVDDNHQLCRILVCCSVRLTPGWCDWVRGDSTDAGIMRQAVVIWLTPGWCYWGRGDSTYAGMMWLRLGWYDWRQDDAIKVKAMPLTPGWCNCGKSDAIDPGMTQLKLKCFAWS